MSMFTTFFHTLHDLTHGLGKSVGSFLSSLADSIAQNGGELLIDAASGPTDGFCPQPVWPTEAAVDWIEHADTPPPVVDWLDRVTRQQELLDRECR